ncbi:LacI family DNA-binding transcriptional regulator [Priestia endophytica]|jgi:DNA-binding LacI/PurR family transcriptional regulator|uniref:Transcriptional regulator, LacI family n=1 Tax=Priestia endophytica DSM 13796 TaxID=1121089 RepID=A0A1I5Y3Z3_9BACI|nr:LacI family DNA-binding transcriptional regulator [Priestia endophytica]KAB2496070.1 LacI family transcriptional regulator [Priestia endophytica]KYG31544.1 transcriptional regulator [Priestia endophytica]MBG9811589.1 transcriptional regulator [Priestia endophytica]RAS74185.1 LacI family transcriptional regulator [Priestia endophytica]SFQ38874.1 transcriptional regulator, LacI family [Priestia endophytica DSM 13796]
MKATIYDVAKKANVSISTVSKVLNGTGNISEKTKKRIRNIIEELQYQPSVVSSVKKAIKTIGLLIPDVANPFMAEVARAVEDSGRKRGFNVIICSTDNDSTREDQYISMLRQKYVDGLIIATGLKNSKAIKELVDSNMPVAMLSRDVPYLPLHTVVVDDFQGGYEAAIHLADLGHKRMAMIAEDVDVPSIKQRAEGFKEGLRLSNLTFNDKDIVYCPHNLHESKKASLKLLKDVSERPTAIFVSTEILALGVLQAARSLNISVPHELSVIGFDNSILAKISDPQLTTIEQPKKEMGEKVIELLISEIEQKSDVKQRVTLSPKLVIRESTSQCRK